MKVLARAVYQGLNVYGPVPVIRITVDLGVWKDWSTRRLGASFVDALFEQVPGLRAPDLGSGWPGADQGLFGDDDQSLAQLAGQVALELQRLAGTDLHLATSGPAGSDGVFNVVYEYEDADVGLRAGRLALGLLNDLVQTRLRPPGKWASGFDLAEGSRRLVRSGQFRHLPVQDAAVVRAARARGIEVIKIRNRIIQLGQGRFQRRMSGSKTSLTNVISSNLASNKEYASRLFAELGLPVAKQKRVGSAKEAVAAAEVIGYPVVIKPITGNLGRGVTVHLTDGTQVKSAYQRARAVGSSVLVEQFIPGTDYRMLVINGALIAVSRRVPAHVVGDGLQSIEALVAEANRDPRRGSKHLSMWTALELDERAHRLLAQQGYATDSIPPQGETVPLRDVANTSAGGTAIDVTDDVHPDNRAMAVRAAQVIGLDVVGVDFLTTDISRSWREIGGAICEINSRPGLRKHMWPSRGKPREVVAPILDMLFPPGTPSSIPIAVISGDQTRATSSLLVQLLKSAGHVVGLATSSGVEVDRIPIVESPVTPPAGARLVLIDPTVDAAVIDASAEEVLDHGLGLYNYQVGAVLGAGDLSEEGQELTKSPVDALRLVLGAAQRLTVLNADDPGCLRLAEGIAAERLFLVTTHGDHPPVLAHLGANGSAVVATADSNAGSIAIYDQGSRVALWSMPGIEGRLSSLGAAVAIAYGLGTTWQAISDGLATLDEAP